MAPVWKVLRSKRNDETWNTSLRAALRSAFANRQWTQTRCYAAHFVKHNRCLLCLDDIIKRRLPHLTDEDRAKVEPTEEDIAEAPIGNAFHRIVVCPRVRKNCAITRPNLEFFCSSTQLALAMYALSAPFSTGTASHYRSHTPKEPSTGSSNLPLRS